MVACAVSAAVCCCTALAAVPAGLVTATLGDAFAASTSYRNPTRGRRQSLACSIMVSCRPHTMVPVLELVAGAPGCIVPLQAGGRRTARSGA